MNWGMKRLLDLAGGAGELNQGTTSGRANLKAVRLEPPRDGVQIGIGRAELFAELGWSEPLVVVRRSLVLLIVEQAPEHRQMTFIQRFLDQWSWANSSRRCRGH